MVDPFWPLYRQLNGMKVSEHFTFFELTTTDHRSYLKEQHQPPPNVRMNLVRLAVDILEPCRSLVGPLRVNSAYRCPDLNKAIGGATKSQHMDGLAADVVPMDMHLIDAYERILQSGIEWDQLIYEFGRWIHVSAPYHQHEPRRQALMIFDPGKYLTFDPKDPRVSSDLLS